MIPDNGICHVQIPAPDLEQVAAFYESVFGWKIQRNVPHEAFWFFDSGNISGAFEKREPPKEEGISLYIKSNDINAALSALKTAGGTVEQEKESLPDNYGFVASFVDPAGNRMGLWSTAEEDA